VPREDVRRALWPEDVHVDFDGGMNYCVRQLRSALGDSARQPRFIETVPRQGYRFIAPVAQRAVTPPRSRRRAWAMAGVAARLTPGAAVVWDARLAGADAKARHHEAAVSLVRAVHRALF
jgi:hypothetical protein